MGGGCRRGVSPLLREAWKVELSYCSGGHGKQSSLRAEDELGTHVCRGKSGNEATHFDLHCKFTQCMNECV